MYKSYPTQAGRTPSDAIIRISDDGKTTNIELQGRHGYSFEYGKKLLSCLGSKNVKQKVAEIEADDKTQWIELVSNLLPYMHTDVIRCNGMKCRELNCMSCNDEGEAQRSVEEMRILYDKARYMLMLAKRREEPL